MLNTPGSLLWSLKPINVWRRTIEFDKVTDAPISTIPESRPMFVVTALPLHAFANWMYVIAEAASGWIYVGASYYQVLDSPETVATTRLQAPDTMSYDGQMRNTTA